jgi:hypothetical protein
MEAVRSSETSVKYCPITQLDLPQDCIVYRHLFGTLKPHKFVSYCSTFMHYYLFYYTHSSFRLHRKTWPYTRTPSENPTIRPSGRTSENTAVLLRLLSLQFLYKRIKIGLCDHHAVCLYIPSINF